MVGKAVAVAFGEWAKPVLEARLDSWATGGLASPIKMEMAQVLPDFLQFADCSEAQPIKLDAWRRVQAGEMQVDRANQTNLIAQIRGPFSVELFRDRLATLAARHQALRCVASERSDGPWFIDGGQPSELPLTVVDLGDAEGDRVGAAREAASQWLWTPFDLAAGLLWRALLIQITPSHWVVGLVMHHSIADGYSMYALKDQLLGRASATKDAPSFGYLGYLRAMQAWIASEEGGRYRLEQADALSDAVADEPSPDAVFYPINIGPEGRGAVRALAAKTGTTPCAILLAVQARLMSAVEARDVVALGVVSSRRGARAVRGTVGDLADRNYLRIDAGPGRDFPAVIAQASSALDAATRADCLPSSLLGTEMERRGQRLLTSSLNYARRRVPLAGKGIIAPFRVERPPSATKLGSSMTHAFEVIEDEDGLRGAFSSRSAVHADLGNAFVHAVSNLAEGKL